MISGLIGVRPVLLSYIPVHAPFPASIANMSSFHGSRVGDSKATDLFFIQHVFNGIDVFDVDQVPFLEEDPDLTSLSARPSLIKSIGAGFSALDVQQDNQFNIKVQMVVRLSPVVKLRALSHCLLALHCLPLSAVNVFLFSRTSTAWLSTSPPAATF